MRPKVIIQARMGSTRFPKKVLADICGKPMLWHLIERLKKCREIDQIIVATSLLHKDDEIELFCKKNKIDCFRGSETDVLDRFYKCALAYKADTIIRITADCPLICPEVVDDVVKEYSKGDYDYVTNTILYTYPDGCDTEVFSFDALKKVWKKCKSAIDREHVTSYMKRSNQFRIKNVENKNPVDYKWSVDNIKDLQFVRRIYRYLYRKNKVFTMKKIIDFIEKHPELKEINKESIINEGYYKSILKTAPIKAKKISINKSLILKERAKNIIPDCSQTFSKSPSQFIQGVAPVFMEKGKGSHVWDVDNNEYIDYAMALGPIILGHNYPAVTDAVNKVLEKSTTFSLPHRLEVELAELLCRIIPCAQMVRFGKNGSDVTSAAVRVARAYTNRDKIVCSGYHGWQDWYIGTTTRNKGVPAQVRDLTIPFEYNKIETLEEIFAKNKKEIACVIMEPVGVIGPADDFLNKVKKMTHKNGALLIFDEIVTGFRLSLGGAQEYFNVIPDLACFGKAMGNGFPISAIVGKKEIMSLFTEVFYSFTFGGEIASIAAAKATIEEFEKNNVIKHLWEQGRKIKDGYNVMAKEYGLSEYTKCAGFYPRTVVYFKDKIGNDDLFLKSLFQQECIKRGVLFTGSHNVCYSHSDGDIDYTLRTYRTVLEILKDAIKKKNVKKLLKGKPLEPVFRKA